jgi:Rap1a immunity proteins
MRTIFLALVGIWLSVIPAAGQNIGFFSGNELLDNYCTPVGDTCRGYIAGVADALNLGNALAGQRACWPKGVSVQQLTDIAVTYLRAHANRRHYSAVSQVAAAIAEAFPCPNAPPELFRPNTW